MKSLFERWADYSIDHWIFGKPSKATRILLIILIIVLLLISFALT